MLLHHNLCPLLLSNLSLPSSFYPTSFPMTLRLIRVVYLLLRSFPDELIEETEMLLSFLLKILSGEPFAGKPVKEPAPEEAYPSRGDQSPSWLRVLALECVRGLCSDSKLLRKIWKRYSEEKEPKPDPPHPDSTNPPTASNLFPALLSTLNRIANEKPSLLGVSAQMNGIGFHLHEPMTGGEGAGSSSSSSAGTGASATASNINNSLEMFSEMVASGMSSVVASLTTDAQAGLGEGSMVKVQWFCLPPSSPMRFFFFGC